MSKLKIGLLGGFEISDADGDAIKLQTDKAGPLLAYLAMTPGKAFPREHPTALPWSD